MRYVLIMVIAAFVTSASVGQVQRQEKKRIRVLRDFENDMRGEKANGEIYWKYFVGHNNFRNDSARYWSDFYLTLVRDFVRRNEPNSVKIYKYLDHIEFEKNLPVDINTTPILAPLDFRLEYFSGKQVDVNFHDLYVVRTKDVSIYVLFKNKRPRIITCFNERLRNRILLLTFQME